MKRIAVIALVLIILATAFTSCGRYEQAKNDDRPDSGVNSDIPTETSSIVPPPTEEPDTSPEVTQPLDETATPDPDSIENTLQPDQNAVNTGDYILSDSNTRRYDYIELYQYFNEPSQASFARNEIFARHGHQFDNKTYQDYFMQKTWYKPAGKVDFNNLNPFEQYNSKLLLFFEKGFQGEIPQECRWDKMQDNPSWLIHTLKPDDEYQVDMDGDSSKETVSWERNMDTEAIITIDSQSVAVPGNNSGNWSDTLAIVDLDASDSFKEIILCDEGPSSDEWSYVYIYKNNKPVLIGEAAGHVSYGSFRPDGKGNVTAYTRASLLHTWFYKKQFKLDTNHRLVATPQDYFPTNHAVFIKNPIQLSKDRKMNGSTFTVKDGQAALLSATDDVKWCRLTLEDGTSGWFSVSDYGTIVRENVQASELLDNLSFAD